MTECEMGFCHLSIFCLNKVLLEKQLSIQLLAIFLLLMTSEKAINLVQEHFCVWITTVSLEILNIFKQEFVA